jgi:hypothetical protein
LFLLGFVTRRDSELIMLEVQTLTTAKKLIGLIAILFTFFVPKISNASEFAFETDSVRFVISSDGTAFSLKDKRTGIELLGPQRTPLASITIKGQSYPSSQIRRDGDIFIVAFGSSGFTANYRFTAKPDHILIELVGVKGGSPDAFQFMQLCTVHLQNRGGLLAVRWNPQYTISLMALSDRVDSKLSEPSKIVSSVYPQFGMVGGSIALIAVPTDRFMNCVEEIEREYHLPSPKLGGRWAKSSLDVKTNYLFTDLSEWNVDEVIRYAKIGGFRYVLVYCPVWSSSFGSYGINLRNFPRGEASLKATIDKCHAAGIKVGMHMMTSLVKKTDALVTPKPDGRLLKKDEGRLAVDIDGTQSNIVAIANHTTSSFGGGRPGPGQGGMDIQIGDEILRCGEIRRTGDTISCQCRRGYLGTKASAHKAGTRIQQLMEIYGCYLVDLRTSLKEQIADRIAGLINRCGFDMIYFDGGEASSIMGPAWYWMGQLQMNVWERVKRDLLVQGSGITHWTWHIFSRGTCDDFAALAPLQYLDYHKIPYASVLEENFMPVDLGWWGLLSYSDAYPASLPDEEEIFGIRMLALDAAGSIETNQDAMKSNGRTDEILTVLSTLNTLRLSGRISPRTREMLRMGEWHLARDGGRVRFQRVRTDSETASLPASISVSNPFGRQAFQFRLEALTSLHKLGDPANIVLFSSREGPIPLELGKPEEAISGSLLRRLEFARSGARGLLDELRSVAKIHSASSALGPLDLHRHRALSITLRVEGGRSSGEVPPPVLNVQLESANGMHRDYYVDLDFSGSKTVTIPESNVARMFPDMIPEAYNLKSSLSTFDYRHVVALNFRCMRQPKNGRVKFTVDLVEALAEDDTILKGVEVAVGGTKLVVAHEVHSGDYLELRADRQLRLYDKNGVLLSTFAIPQSTLTLERGQNTITITAEGLGRVKLKSFMLSQNGIEI